MMDDAVESMRQTEDIGNKSKNQYNDFMLKIVIHDKNSFYDPLSKKQSGYISK